MGHNVLGGWFEQTWLCKMPPKKARCLALGIFNKVHYMSTAQNVKDRSISGDI